MGCGGGNGRCRKGEGNEVREEMWGSVLGPHPNTVPYTSPIPLPIRQHTFPHSPHTLSHTPPHISFLASPHTPAHFTTPPPTPLPTAPLTSPYTPTHFPLTQCTLPHLPPQFELCGEVTM